LNGGKRVLTYGGEGGKEKEKKGEKAKTTLKLGVRALMSKGTKMGKKKEVFHYDTFGEGTRLNS